MKSYDTEFWDRLFREGIADAQAMMKRYIKEYAPRGYPPLTTPEPIPPTEAMDVNTFLSLPPEKQRYHLRKVAEGGSAEQV
jgi:hypothetical protein